MLVFFSNLLAIDSKTDTVLINGKPIIFKHYIGLLYTNINPRVYESQDNVGMRVALWPQFDLAYGWQANIVAVYKSDGSGLGAPFVQKNFSDGFVRVGWQPQLIRTLNCPSSVSDGGHFQPLSKAVIPGLLNGVLVNYKSAYLAGYPEKQGFRGSVGWKQKIGPVNLTTSGFLTDYQNYAQEKANGWAVKIDNDLFEVMYFQTNSIDSSNAQSFAINLNLPQKSGAYISSVYQYQKWRQFAVGVYKYYDENIFGLNIHYMVCMDYLYSEVKPKSFNIYFQTWI